ncbi:hypothetical protein E4U28_002943, partial [Claviceps purpurea]
SHEDKAEDRSTPSWMAVRAERAALTYSHHLTTLKSLYVPKPMFAPKPTYSPKPMHAPKLVETLISLSTVHKLVKSKA